MKNLLILFLFSLALIGSCEPDSDGFGGRDTYTEIGDELPPVQRVIVQAAWDGSAVTIVPDDDGTVDIRGVAGVEVAFAWEVLGIPEAEFNLNASLNIKRLRSALLTCPALGLPSPEYDWLCCIEGSRGVALGTDDELKIYIQSPSLQHPNPMTFKLYFSTNWYPLYAWTDDECEDLEDDVDAWPGPGPGYENWNDQIEQWCGIDYPELCCPDE